MGRLGLSDLNICFLEDTFWKAYNVCLFIICLETKLHNAPSTEFLFTGIIIILGPTKGGNLSFFILRNAKVSGEQKKAGREVVTLRWEEFCFLRLITLHIHRLDKEYL